MGGNGGISAPTVYIGWGQREHTPVGCSCMYSGLGKHGGRDVEKGWEVKRLGGGGLALEVVGPFAPPSHHLGKILKGDYCQPLRRFVTVCVRWVGEGGVRS